jgi:hypothetical protein
MELVPLGSIPFHQLFANPNNGILLFTFPFHSIPPHTTNPNIALRQFSHLLLNISLFNQCGTLVYT